MKAYEIDMGRLKSVIGPEMFDMLFGDRSSYKQAKKINDDADHIVEVLSPTIEGLLKSGNYNGIAVVTALADMIKIIENQALGDGVPAEELEDFNDMVVIPIIEADWINVPSDGECCTCGCCDEQPSTDTVTGGPDQNPDGAIDNTDGCACDE